MDARRLLDSLFTVTVTLLALAAVLPIFHIILYITVKGLPVVMEAGIDFFTEIPPSPIRTTELGGIAPALAGTLFMTTVATLLSVPIAVLAAVFSAEYPNHSLTRVVRATTRSLLEVPTIVIGIVVFALLVQPFGRFTALAGAVALAIVMIPYVYTYTELALLSVPRTYIEAGYGIGLKRAQVIYMITAGVARRGIARGVTVAIAKAMGETAPLLFTAFGARNMIFGGPLEPSDAITLMIYVFIQSPFEHWHKIAWGAAFVLLVLYLALFLISRRLVKEVRL
ncbi:MAG: phosphate ABC transporter permease PstA [Acidilobaceae archaeon]|nr:phosphate ABC transporter permease PstA [Acidilobaceae archaeon]